MGHDGRWADSGGPRGMVSGGACLGNGCRGRAQYWFTGAVAGTDGDRTARRSSRAGWRDSPLSPPVEPWCWPTAEPGQTRTTRATAARDHVAIGGWVAPRSLALPPERWPRDVWTRTPVRRCRYRAPPSGVAPRPPRWRSTARSCPERPAALACLLGVAALTGPPRSPARMVLRRGHVAVAVGKYTRSRPHSPGWTGALVARRRRGAVIHFRAALAAAWDVLAVHRCCLGWWTVYASATIPGRRRVRVRGVDPDYRSGPGGGGCSSTGLRPRAWHPAGCWWSPRAA